eukprot:Sspe_Gene.15496::Locus_5393_Transcript_1_1_Confidence_1.000_Length_2138::g.15496::m.15496
MPDTQHTSRHATATRLGTTIPLPPIPTAVKPFFPPFLPYPTDTPAASHTGQGLWSPRTPCSVQDGVWQVQSSRAATGLLVGVAVPEVELKDIMQYADDRSTTGKVEEGTVGVAPRGEVPLGAAGLVAQLYTTAYTARR